MLTPGWLTDGLAVVMLTVSVYCASRLVVARLRHRRTHYAFDAVHTAMGVAMAGMLTSRLASTTGWIVVFAVAAGWFGLRAIGSRRASGPASIGAGSYVRHLVTSGAMVYMLTATPAAVAATPTGAGSAGGMGAAGDTATRFPTVALLLVLFMIGYTIMVTDRFSRTRADVETPGTATILAPGAVACCQVAMNITMGYMLVTLL